MHKDIDPYPDVGYDQVKRPQFHFSSKKNWINDPNGLVYYEGEYHLFFQHNPGGCQWGNIGWGHAVSKDLLHWKQIQHAILPDERGFIASGSAVVDHADTAGFQAGEDKAMVAVFTYAGDRVTPKRPLCQAIAYSNDRGRTFTKYAGNPVVENISGGPDRDPKVFWYAPPASDPRPAASGTTPPGWWVMVLFLAEPRQALGIFTSPNLKEWKLESKIGPFYECPELFELPVDGDPANTRWIIYGADYNYYIGDFNGKAFTPEHTGKHRCRYGTDYASQSWNDEPRSRRITVGWGRIEMKDMPFNQMLLFPVELSLRTTDEGLRLFTEPIEELDRLRGTKQVDVQGVAVTPESPLAVRTTGDLFEVALDIELGSASKVRLIFNDMTVCYDAEVQTLQEAPLTPVEGRIRVRILIDRPSIEIFGNGGRVYIAGALPSPGAAIETMQVAVEGGPASVVSMTVFELKSVWRDP
jgi:fructan beta-fructosidase